MRNQGILTFLIFLLALLGVWFIIIPGASDLMATQQRIAQYANAKDIAAQIKDVINKQYAGYDAELAKAHDYLGAVPNSASQSDLLVEIQEIGTLSGLTPDNIDIDFKQTNRNQAPGNQNAPPALRSIPVKISLAGDYSGVRQFLALAERNLPLLDASEMAISPGTAIAEKKAVSPYKIQITFQTYALK